MYILRKISIYDSVEQNFDRRIRSSLHGGISYQSLSLSSLAEVRSSKQMQMKVKDTDAPSRAQCFWVSLDLKSSKYKGQTASTRNSLNYILCSWCHLVLRRWDAVWGHTHYRSPIDWVHRCQYLSTATNMCGFLPRTVSSVSLPSFMGWERSRYLNTITGNGDKQFPIAAHALYPVWNEYTHALRPEPLL